MRRPCVLSIAGFDPSGGAGVIADCKTFEVMDCTGLAAITALTFQNEKMVSGVQWCSFAEIEKQLQPLLSYYPIEVVKIGIVQSASMLSAIVHYIHDSIAKPQIIWDPVIRATAGYSFFDSNFDAIPYEQLSLLTPNSEELLLLTSSEEKQEALAVLSERVPLYVKSYDRQQSCLMNVLVNRGQRRIYEVELLHDLEKHGSGCVASSAIAAGLAHGLALEVAIEQAEKYTAQFLKSSSELLGYHGGVNETSH